MFIRTVNAASTGNVNFANVDRLRAGGSGDTQAPTTPGQPSCGTITANSIALSWGASTDNLGVIAYDIYHDGNKLAEAAGTVTTKNLTGLSPNTEYRLSVFARDAAGNVSFSSAQAICTTLPSSDIVAPTAPANKREQPYARDQWRRRTNKPVYPDPEVEGRIRYPHQLEPRLLVPLAHLRYQIRWPTVPGPHHEPARRAELGRRRDRRVDVSIGDVPEHPTHQYQIRRYMPHVVVCPRGVPHEDGDPGQPRSRSPSGIPRIQFHQPGVNVDGPGMGSQHLQQIPAFARAHAHHPYRPGGKGVERDPDPVLYRRKPPGQCRSRHVVAAMPVLPVFAVHAPTLGKPRLGKLGVPMAAGGPSAGSPPRPATSWRIHSCAGAVQGAYRLSGVVGGSTGSLALSSGKEFSELLSVSVTSW